MMKTGGAFRPSDKRSFDLASWAVLGAAVLVFTLSLVVSFYRNSLPSDGWQTAAVWSPDGRLVFRENLTDAPSPLEKGDILVAIEGQPFEEIQDRALALRPQRPPDWEPGETVRYTVLRDGRDVTLDVPLRDQPASLIPRGYASDVLGPVVQLSLLVISLFVFLRRPRDRAARLLFLFSALVASTAVPFRPADMFYPLAYWPVWALENLKWMLLIGPILTHLVLVFPTEKRFLRRRPRLWLGAIYGSAPVAFLVALGLSGDWTRAFWPTYATLNLIGILVFISAMVLSQGHAFLTIEDPVARAQLRWLAFGLVVGLGGGIATYALQAWLLGPSPALEALIGLFFLVLPISLAVAILRYRLFDIDLVINRTLVYGALTASVVGIYVLVVGYLGALFRTGGDLLISLVATGIVAVLFAPLRDRLQRGVNRLMYGERDDPYGVLSRLGQRLEATLEPHAVLPAVAETVAHALKLPHVAIELKRGEEYETVAEYGRRVGEPLRLPLVYGTETVGLIILSPRSPGESFTPADRRLLDDLARQAGIAAHAVRLTDELQRSRERLVATREEERRRIRRNLHDGLGPALSSAMLKLGAARRLLPPSSPADDLVVEVRDDMRATVNDVRRLVYYLRPPALDQLGLVLAVREYSEQCGDAGESGGEGGLRVTVDASEQLPPLPAAVEVAAYYIAREALTNAARHARAHSCRVRLAFEDAPERPELWLEISDDGVGLPKERTAGVGLSSMRERAEELGGTWTVESPPGGGTRVLARLPVGKE